MCECDILEIWPHWFFQCAVYHMEARVCSRANSGNNSIWSQQVNKIFSLPLSHPHIHTIFQVAFNQWMYPRLFQSFVFFLFHIFHLQFNVIRYGWKFVVRCSLFLKIKTISIDPLISVLYFFFFGYFNHVAPYNWNWKRNHWDGNRNEKYEWETTRATTEQMPHQI